FLEYHDIPVPHGVVRTRRERRVPLPRGFGFPVVVKPINQGSTLGISIVRRSRDLAAGIELALTYGPTALVEEYINGRELTVGVVNDQPLPVVEAILQSAIERAQVFEKERVLREKAYSKGLKSVSAGWGKRVGLGRPRAGG